MSDNFVNLFLQVLSSRARFEEVESWDFVIFPHFCHSLIVYIFFGEFLEGLEVIEALANAVDKGAQD